MSETNKITCDGCKQDITYTGNIVDYRLILKNESIPTDPKFNAVTDMMIYPSLKDGSKHFCGLGCLKSWMLSL